MDPDDVQNKNLMTPGDAMAELERTLPKLDVTPKTLFPTKPSLLAPGHRVIAVSSKVIGDNSFVNRFENYRPVVEVWDLPENGDMAEAKLFGVFRHVEVLGASWIHHDPENGLQYQARRGSVLVTKSALRVYEDTPENVARIAESEKAVPKRFGC